MSRSRTIDVPTAAMAASAALAAATLAWAGLWLIARAPQTGARLAVMERQVGAIRATQATLRGSAKSALGSVCDSPADDALSALKQKLSAQMAAGVGGTVAVDGAPQPPDEGNGGLQRVNLTIEATASYPLLMQMLQGLTRNGPSVFVETLDMKPANGSVNLKLSGRFYCSPVHL
jgi:hypothetical protein